MVNFHDESAPDLLSADLDDVTRVMSALIQAKDLTLRLKSSPAGWVITQGTEEGRERLRQLLAS